MKNNNWKKVVFGMWPVWGYILLMIGAAKSPNDSGWALVAIIGLLGVFVMTLTTLEEEDYPRKG